MGQCWEVCQWYNNLEFPTWMKNKYGGSFDKALFGYVQIQTNSILFYLLFDGYLINKSPNLWRGLSCHRLPFDIYIRRPRLNWDPLIVFFQKGNFQLWGYVSCIIFEGQNCFLLIFYNIKHLWNLISQLFEK